MNANLLLAIKCLAIRSLANLHLKLVSDAGSLYTLSIWHQSHCRYAFAHEWNLCPFCLGSICLAAIVRSFDFYHAVVFADNHSILGGYPEEFRTGILLEIIIPTLIADMLLGHHSVPLAARGLDIPGIENVVHYHPPVNEEAYTHRNGRTARWEASGNAYLVLHAEERVPEYISEDIETYEFPETLPKPAKPRWATLYIGKGKKDKLNKIDIVGFLYKKGGMAREDVGQVDVKEHYAFVAVRRSKMKQLLTLVRGEKIKGMKTVIEEAK